MAPPKPAGSRLERRQAATDLPACVTTCAATADIGNCTSLTDTACLCTSSTYINSVGACWLSSCTPVEIAVGQAYSSQACAAVLGTNSTSSAVVSASTIIASASATVTSSAPTIDTTSPPITFHTTFVNVQAIMSSICSALLALALVLGIISCRNKARRNREATQNRTWTGVGGSSYGNTNNTNGATGKSTGKLGISRNAGANSSVFTNSRNQTSTFASDNYGVSSSNFGGNSQIPGQGLGVGFRQEGGKGFSNRQTLGETSEEWEMGTKGDVLEGGELESPTKDKEGSEVELGSSTAKLNYSSEPGKAI